MKTSRAFTLIELLVVVLIIGILAAVALPQYQLAVDKARFMEMFTASRALAPMLEMYYLTNGEYPDYWKKLDVTIPGCTETKSALYDLKCKGFAIDLNASTFVAWTGARTGEGKNPDIAGRIEYAFGSGATNRLKCLSRNSRGKRVCKSLCGSETCYL